MGKDYNTSHNITFKLDDTSFEKLFADYYTALCRFALQFVHRTDVAEEIVQEQFISLWEKRDEITIHFSVKSYLYTAVKNKSIDYLRSRYAKTQFVSDEFLSETKSSFDTYAAIEEQEIATIITEAMEALPEKCAIIFSMKRYGELTNKQIADELNISEKTVENQITIAFKKLRPILSKCLLLAGTIFLS